MVSIKRLENSYIMYDDATVLGKCEFSDVNKTINKFCNNSEQDDIYIITNLCKAVLNYFEIHNMMDIKCLDHTYDEILFTLGFNDNLEINLTNYFTKKCEGEQILE